MMMVEAHEKLIGLAYSKERLFEYFQISFKALP